MASINVEKEVLGSIGGIIKIHNYRTADDGHSHSNTDIDLSVPCPDTIPKERHDEFFRRSYEELQKVFDGCLIDGMVHKDEVHTYIDPTTKTERISLEHMHIVGVPFTETNEK